MNTNSDEFISVLTWSGHSRVNCDCGRIHTALLNEDLDENEKNLVIRESKENKVLYIVEENLTYIELAEIGTMRVVKNCPCMQLLEMEKFIFKARKPILSYFAKIIEKAERENQELRKAVYGLNMRLFENG